MVDGPIETRLAVSKVLAEVVGVEVHFNPLNRIYKRGNYIVYGAA
jgi:hypothetical protein